MVENIRRPMSMGPGCTSFAVNFLIRSDAMWNTMAGDRTFSKSVVGSFDRSIACREGKSVSRVSVYSSKDKTLPLSRWKRSNVINLPPGSWLITPGNDAILGTQCWSLLLADCSISSDHSYISLNE